MCQWAAPAGRKQRSMPAEQALGGEWIVVVLGRVEHHLDDTLDVAVGRLDGVRATSEPGPGQEPRLRFCST